MRRWILWMGGIMLLLAAVAAWWLRPPYYAPVPVGTLSLADGLAGDWRLGGFRVELQGGTEAQFQVTRVGGQTVFASRPGESFAGAARATAQYAQGRGMTRLNDLIHETCTDQTIEAATLTADGLTLTGTFACTDGSVPYTLRFAAKTTGHLAFTGALEGDGANRLILMGSSTADEGFFGLGTQYSFANLKGQRLPVLVTEQGIGRGLQPLSVVADLLHSGSGGSWYTSYAPVPMMVTQNATGLFLSRYEPAIFDLRADERFTVTALSPVLEGGFLGGATPLDVISEYTAAMGRMRAGPVWAGQGAILGLQGGTEIVRARVAAAQEAGVPIAAVWLQDWVGQRVTDFGKQLWWSWTLDRERYPGWEQLVADLEADGIRVLTYVNPFLVDVSAAGGERRNLFQEAKELGFLVADETGEPIMLTITFPAALIDLANPEAVAWYKAVIREEVAGVGASGWMADFGEAMPIGPDAPAAFHNQYPDLWAQLNRDVLTELALDEAFVFHRAGYARAQADAAFFWLGDQMVTWDAMDGLKTVVTGLTSSGISGYGLNHADIGGYTTITSPIRNYHRSKELFMRWAELTAFTPAFRTHEGNQPDNNHQFHSDAQTLTHFAHMAGLFACLAPYRDALAQDMAEQGWPLVRHPMLHYPRDPAFHQMHYEQFMLGSDLMVVPVLDPQTDEVTAVLPDGGWIHGWSGTAYGAGRHSVPAPLGQPPVFVRAEAPGRRALLSCFQTRD